MKRPELVILVDTREQHPLSFDARAVPATLNEGDYTAIGVEHIIRLERKSSADLCNSIQRDHARFGLELARLADYARAEVVIDDAANVEEAAYRGRADASKIGKIIDSLELDYRIRFRFMRHRIACADYVEAALLRTLHHHEEGLIRRCTSIAERCGPLSSAARIREIALATLHGICPDCARRPGPRPKELGEGICVCGRTALKRESIRA